MNYIFRKFISLSVIWALIALPITPINNVYAQSVVNVPLPVTATFQPILIKGLTIHPENPLLFDFIIHPGDEHPSDQEFQKQSQRLIKYFLASLTVPEKEMWVNLSPTEKDRIIPDEFGKTEMGRDLLMQDYFLKQLTAALISPDNETGKKLWEKIYTQAQAKFGITDIPMDVLSKVWIVPETAKIYLNGKSVFVVDAHLKVLMEGEYKSEDKIQELKSADYRLQTEIIKQILIPALEREVNTGANFANLRQIYNSVILATWYKKNLKESLLGKVYVDQDKTKGVNHNNPQAKEDIYNKYLEAFKKGTDSIKEEYDPATQEVVARKYISGGMDMAQLGEKVEETGAQGLEEKLAGAKNFKIRMDAAITAEQEDLTKLPVFNSAVDIWQALGDGDRAKEDEVLRQLSEQGFQVGIRAVTDQDRRLHEDYLKKYDHPDLIRSYEIILELFNQSNLETYSQTIDDVLPYAVQNVLQHVENFNENPARIFFIKKEAELYVAVLDAGEGMDVQKTFDDYRSGKLRQYKKGFGSGFYRSIGGLRKRVFPTVISSGRIFILDGSQLQEKTLNRPLPKKGVLWIAHVKANPQKGLGDSQNEPSAEESGNRQATYDIRLQKMKGVGGRDVGWSALRLEDGLETRFLVKKASLESLSESQRLQVINLYRELIYPLSELSAWKQVSEIFETQCLIVGNEIAGIYSIDPATRFIQVVNVSRQFRGTGAVDVLFEDLQERFGNGDTEADFSIDIVRQSPQAVYGEYHGTLREIKKRLGVASQVTVAEEREDTAMMASAFIESAMARQLADPTIDLGRAVGSKLGIPSELIPAGIVFEKVKSGLAASKNNIHEFDRVRNYFRESGELPKKITIYFDSNMEMSLFIHELGHYIALVMDKNRLKEFVPIVVRQLAIVEPRALPHAYTKSKYADAFGYLKTIDQDPEKLFNTDFDEELRREVIDIIEDEWARGLGYYLGYSLQGDLRPASVIRLKSYSDYFQRLGIQQPLNWIDLNKVDSVMISAITESGNDSKILEKDLAMTSDEVIDGGRLLINAVEDLDDLEDDAAYARITYNGSIIRVPLLHLAPHSIILDLGNSVLRIFTERDGNREPFDDEFLKNVKALGQANVSPKLISSGISADGRLFLQLEKVVGQNLSVFVKERRRALNDHELELMARNIYKMIRNRKYIEDLAPDNFMFGYRIGAQSKMKKMYFIDIEEIEKESPGEIINLLIDQYQTIYRVLEDRYVGWSTYDPKRKIEKFLLSLKRQYQLQGNNMFRANVQTVSTALIEAGMKDRHNSDGAMVADDLGGIDLNPDKIQFDQQGQKVDFNLPSNDSLIQQYLNVEGFEPVIINITPITNIPLLLGTAQAQPHEELLSKI